MGANGVDCEIDYQPAIPLIQKLKTVLAIKSQQFLI
jgi:hypothetical protein